MTVPAGHSHPFIAHIRGQGGGSSRLLQVTLHEGSEAHSFLICPITGHTA